MLADIGPNTATVVTALVTLLILQVVGLVKQWMDKRDTDAKLVVVEEKVEAVPAIAENVAILEKSMNSMKDAQVAMAGKLGTAEGEIKGRADERADADEQKRGQSAVIEQIAVDVKAVPTETAEKVVEKLKPPEGK